MNYRYIYTDWLLDIGLLFLLWRGSSFSFPPIMKTSFSVIIVWGVVDFLSVVYPSGKGLFILVTIFLRCPLQAADAFAVFSIYSAPPQFVWEYVSLASSGKHFQPVLQS